MAEFSSPLRLWLWQLAIASTLVALAGELPLGPRAPLAEAIEAAPTELALPKVALPEVALPARVGLEHGRLVLPPAIAAPGDKLFSIPPLDWTSPFDRREGTHPPITVMPIPTEWIARFLPIPTEWSADYLLVARERFGNPPAIAAAARAGEAGQAPATFDPSARAGRPAATAARGN